MLFSIWTRCEIQVWNTIFDQKAHQYVIDIAMGNPEVGRGIMGLNRRSLREVRQC